MQHSKSKKWRTKLMRSPDSLPHQNVENFGPPARHGGQFYGDMRGSYKSKSSWIVVVSFVILVITSLNFRHCQAKALEIPGPPRLVETASQTVDISALSTLEIPCKTTGSPAPSVTWYLNEVEIDFSPVNDEKLRKGADGSLFFNLQVNRNITGSYRCVARNEHGVAISNVTRITNSDGAWEKASSSKTTMNFVLNDSLVLNCTDDPVEESPGISISWWKGTTERYQLKNNKKHVITSNGKLALIYTDNEDSNAVYYCQVDYHDRKKGYFVKNNYTLQLTENSGWQILVPKLLQVYPPTIRVAVHQPFSIQCLYGGMTSAGELPATVWEEPSGVRHNNSILNVDNASVVQHNGKFTCSANFPILSPSQYTSTTVKVIVEVPATLIQPLYDRTVGNGSHVEIRCQARGQPQPNIIWFVNGTKVTSNMTKISVSQDGEELTIQGISYKTSVACQVHNGYKEIVSNANIFVVEKVNQPVVSLTFPPKQPTGLLAGSSQSSQQKQLSSLSVPHKSSSTMSIPNVNDPGNVKDTTPAAISHSLDNTSETSKSKSSSGTPKSSETTSEGKVESTSPFEAIFLVVLIASVLIAIAIIAGCCFMTYRIFSTRSPASYNVSKSKESVKLTAMKKEPEFDNNPGGNQRTDGQQGPQVEQQNLLNAFQQHQQNQQILPGVNDLQTQDDDSERAVTRNFYILGVVQQKGGKIQYKCFEEPDVLRLKDTEKYLTDRL